MVTLIRFYRRMRVHVYGIILHRAIIRLQIL